MENTNMPRVLVLSRNAWNTGNCTGNTLSNFFKGYPRDRIANAFFRKEAICNDVCADYFCVGESDLIANFAHPERIGEEIREVPLSSAVDTDCADCTENQRQVASWYSFFSKHRWTVALWLRDALWGLNGWKNARYDAFLKRVSPDVIYMPCYDSAYMHRILWYTARKTGARVVLFTGDDTYTLKQFNLSPLYWIDRLLYRRVMRRSVKMADTLFVISELQKQEYERLFKRECVLLRKGGDFSGGFTPKDTVGDPIRLVYTGNIHSGRWKTLADIAQAIAEINRYGVRMQLDIYSLSAKSEAMLRALNIPGASRTMPPASDEEIGQALRDADMLVFVDPFALREKLLWRLSFSTKIVDYLSSSRPIFAVGPKEPASMQFLISNDAALCASNEAEISRCLQQVVQHPERLREYAEKAWQCGSEKTRAEQTQTTLFEHLTGMNYENEHTEENR